MTLIAQYIPHPDHNMALRVVDVDENIQATFTPTEEAPCLIHAARLWAQENGHVIRRVEELRVIDHRK